MKKGDVKVHQVGTRLSDKDFETLNRLIEHTSSETNIKVTKSDMISKLIRDAAERMGV